jgi:hypothetical protein
VSAPLPPPTQLEIDLADRILLRLASCGSLTECRTAVTNALVLYREGTTEGLLEPMLAVWERAFELAPFAFATTDRLTDSERDAATRAVQQTLKNAIESVRVVLDELRGADVKTSQPSGEEK